MTKTKTQDPSSIPVQSVMGAIDTRNADFWDSLTEEQQKKFSAWIYMRYASACDSKIPEISQHYLRMINDFVNVGFNDLRHHPQLQLQLLCLAGIGKKQYHPWTKPPKGAKKDKLTTWISEVFPHLKNDEIELFKSMNTEQDYKQLAEDLGYTDKQIKELFK